ncbi:hypothetical protein SAMN05421640_2853 [Ekhidna lutea]|uniref:Uncharacterized protein n=1 Tax=Ekhidna lutea TaxID=447679 RepID=A0A239KTS9_EKHLU|nr:hypothetical protein [Ekhidna lutea]SNT20644.1 hypothetical protein SAMN05421640_2853 [Ekhidna lutea]
MNSVLSFCLMTFLLISCSSDEPKKLASHTTVVISESLYNQTKTDNYTIEEAVIVGDSLKVTLQSSGCDGSEWAVKLVDSGAIAESYPVQRFAKIALENTELCDAIVTKEYSIDITPLRVEDQLYLNLEGWETQLHYDF